MKKIIVFAVSLLFLALPGVTKADMFLEHVFNGDFEADPMGFGWQTSSWGNAQSNMLGAWGAGNIHSGTRGVRMSAFGPSTSQLQQAIEVQGKTYRIDFSFWYKVSGPSSTSDFAPVIDYSLKSMTEVYSPLVTGCDDSLNDITKVGQNDLRGGWRQASCMFERYDGEELKPDSYIISISLRSWGDVVQLSLDDVSVVSRTYDRIPPILEYENPAWGSTVTTSAIQVVGNARDNETGLKAVEVKLDGQWVPVPVDANGRFRTSLNLSPGKNVVRFQAIDHGQNITWSDYEITYHEAGTVLGATTVRPTVTTLRSSGGRLPIGQGAMKKIITPFRGYEKGLWARRVKTADGSIFYVVASTEKSERGGMKVLNAAGKTLQVIKPFGNYKPGYNLTMSVDQSTEKIFLAVAPRQFGSTVTIDEFRDGRLHFVATMHATTLSGNMRVKFVSDGSDALRLVTVVDGRMKTLKMWKYSAAKKTFTRDLGFDTRRVRISSSSILLR